MGCMRWRAQSRPSPTNAELGMVVINQPTELMGIRVAETFLSHSTSIAAGSKQEQLSLLVCPSFRSLLLLPC
jgi:hypothetical protein